MAIIFGVSIHHGKLHVSWQSSLESPQLMVCGMRHACTWLQTQFRMSRDQHDVCMLEWQCYDTLHFVQEAWMCACCHDLLSFPPAAGTVDPCYCGATNIPLLVSSKRTCMYTATAIYVACLALLNLQLSSSNNS